MYAFAVEFGGIVADVDATATAEVVDWHAAKAAWFDFGRELRLDAMSLAAKSLDPAVSTDPMCPAAHVICPTRATVAAHSVAPNPST